jgi:hypothetical protein
MNRLSYLSNCRWRQSWGIACEKKQFAVAHCLESFLLVSFRDHVSGWRDRDGKSLELQKTLSEARRRKY